MKAINKVRDNLDILYAITLLEYHNSNYLEYDNKKRNEEKQRLLEECRCNIKAFLKRNYNMEIKI